MKKTFLILMMLLSSSIMNAQLNANAQLIKEKLPEEYELIKLLVSEDWEGDHKMMVYIINKQSNSFINVMKFQKESNYDDAILSKSLSEWSKIIDEKNCTDWSMVEYIYKNQIKAKEEY